jgi:hypothetical protein
MSADHLTQPPAGEREERTPGYVKEKIKTSKKAAPLTRTRVRASEIVRKLKPVSSVIRSLIEAIGQEDVDLVVKVWREAMTATRKFQSNGEWIEEPDHKTRLEASKLLVAYKEGLPIQRQIVATTNVDDFPERLRRLQQSERYRQLVARGEAPPNRGPGNLWVTARIKRCANPVYLWARGDSSGPPVSS